MTQEPDLFRKIKTKGTAVETLKFIWNRCDAILSRFELWFRKCDIVKWDGGEKFNLQNTTECFCERRDLLIWNHVVITASLCNSYVNKNSWQLFERLHILISLFSIAESIDLRQIKLSLTATGWWLSQPNERAESLGSCFH